MRVRVRVSKGRGVEQHHPSKHEEDIVELAWARVRVRVGVSASVGVKVR